MGWTSFSKLSKTTWKIWLEGFSASPIFLEAFPLNTNGKIDYAAFPEPDFSTFQSNYVAPKTPTEEIIANIWNQVIKIENIGINDDFFELGGDSLLAIQVVSRIREILNIEIPISLLFEYPTIAQIAQNITLKAANNNDFINNRNSN